MSEEQAVTGDGAASAGLLQVTVPLAPAYSSERVTVEQTTVTVSIPLVAGEQRTTTPEQVVGTAPGFANPNLIGTFTVWSDYDPTTETLTFKGNDFVDPDSTYLSTYMQGGRNQTCKQHAYIDDTEPCGGNPDWNYCTDLTPGLMELLRETVRSANEAIVEAAYAQGFAVLVKTPLPPIGALETSRLRAVYENGVFKELFDPEKEYGEGTEVIGIESIFGGVITLQPKTFFANVIGSTKDPRIDGESWRGLWEEYFGEATICTSYHFPRDFPCGSTLLGGHVLRGQKPAEVPVGTDQVVLIMPICVQHNNNNKVFMSALYNQQAVVLDKYMQKEEFLVV